MVLGDESQEFGYLSLQLALQIDQLPAGRLQVVNTDDFIVTIHNAADGSEVIRFDPFSSAPAEIELVTGEYFVRATNLDPPANAEFEQPWYFGESTVFNIDKEEVKTIDVTCALANFKVSFVYSQNVIDNFTDWNATATLINEGDFLFWPMGDDREGYFITSPLDINVYLEYTKVFTGELITRNFVTTIDDPQPATHYRINVDASLEDGKIIIVLTVDESFDMIDIDLGDGVAQTTLKNCKEILLSDPSSPNGIYFIDPDGSDPSNGYDCFCDMTTNGGGWTLVWQKMTGSSGHPVYGITWEDALNRIPQETQNVYTGLNIWNQIIGPENGSGELLYKWNLPNDTPDQAFTATLQNFAPEDNYAIHLSNYIQLLGQVTADLWTYHNNIPFSSFDNDNDLLSGNCSLNWDNSAFWYNSCWLGMIWGFGESNPNGNGAYWNSSLLQTGSVGGTGYGNGYMYIR